MLKKTTIHIIPFLIVFVVAIRNAIPDGYIVSGGDFIQWFNFPRMLLNYSYIWANESLGYPQISYPYKLYYQFYAPLAGLFEVQGSGQSILYYVVFLFGSYISFYLAISCNEKHFHNINRFWRVTLSIGYAFNIFTFYNFIALWGFSPFLFLYVLLPIIFGLTIRYFSDPNLNTRDLALIGLVFFLTNISNGNFPFIVSLHFVLFIFVFSIIYVFNINNNRIKRIVLYYLVIALATCWSIIPQLFILLNKGNRIISGDTAISLSEWVLGQAARFPDPFLIVNDHQFFLQFPLLLLSSIALFITAILSLLFLSNLRSRKNIKKFAWSMFFLYLITIFLLNKGRGFLPDFLISFLFANTIMGALRSFHKTIIFIPFILFFIILIGIANNDKYLRHVKFFAALAIILPLVYFLRGGILVNFSYNYSFGENFKTSTFAPIIKIPIEYSNVGSLLNQDKGTHRILSAPYSLAHEKLGWRFIPKWKYQGTSDPLWQMFDAPMVQMNDVSLFNGWNYGKDWDQDPLLHSTWIVRLAGLMNVKYILFHTDIDPNILIRAEKKIDYLEKMGLLTLEIVNDQCKVYKINEKYYYPRIYLARHPVELTDNIPFSIYSEVCNLNKMFDAFFQEGGIPKSGLKRLYNSTAEKEVKIEYKKVSSAKYRVLVHNAKDPIIVVQSEAFHEQWGVYLNKINRSKNPTEERKGSLVENVTLPDGTFYETWFDEKVSTYENHFVANGYANSWVINAEKVCSTYGGCVRNEDGSYEMELIIEYWPQNLLLLTFSISLMTLLLCLARVVFKKRILE